MRRREGAQDTAAPAESMPRCLPRGERVRRARSVARLGPALAAVQERRRLPALAAAPASTRAAPVTTLNPGSCVKSGGGVSLTLTLVRPVGAGAKLAGAWGAAGAGARGGRAAGAAGAFGAGAPPGLPLPLSRRDVVGGAGSGCAARTP